MKTRENDRDAGELSQLISFTVGEEDFGLELRCVKEVIRLREITRLPRAASAVKGVINLRGDVIPVVDMRELFGLPARQATGSTRVIVVEVDGRLTGMIVDAASQVVRVPADSIDAPPRALGGRVRQFIAGVAKLEDRLVLLLTVDALLTREELSTLSSLGQPAAPLALAASS